MWSGKLFVVLAVSTLMFFSINASKALITVKDQLPNVKSLDYEQVRQTLQKITDESAVETDGKPWDIKIGSAQAEQFFDDNRSKFDKFREDIKANRFCKEDPGDSTLKVLIMGRNPSVWAIIENANKNANKEQASKGMTEVTKGCPNLMKVDVEGGKSELKNLPREFLGLRTVNVDLLELKGLLGIKTKIEDPNRRCYLNCTPDELEFVSKLTATLNSFTGTYHEQMRQKFLAVFNDTSEEHLLQKEIIPVKSEKTGEITCPVIEEFIAGKQLEKLNEEKNAITERLQAIEDHKEKELKRLEQLPKTSVQNNEALLAYKRRLEKPSSPSKDAERVELLERTIAEKKTELLEKRGQRTHVVENKQTYLAQTRGTKPMESPNCRIPPKVVPPVIPSPKRPPGPSPSLSGERSPSPSSVTTPQREVLPDRSAETVSPTLPPALSPVSSPPSSPPPGRAVPPEVTALMTKLTGLIKTRSFDFRIPQRGTTAKFNADGRYIGRVKLELDTVDREEEGGAYWDPAFLSKHCENIQKRDSTKKSTGTYKIVGIAGGSGDDFYVDLRRAESYKTGLKMLEILAQEERDQKSLGLISAIKRDIKLMYAMCLQYADKSISEDKKAEIKNSFLWYEKHIDAAQRSLDPRTISGVPREPRVEPPYDPYTKAKLVSWLMVERTPGNRLTGSSAERLLTTSGHAVDQEILTLLPQLSQSPSPLPPPPSPKLQPSSPTSSLSPPPSPPLPLPVPQTPPKPPSPTSSLSLSPPSPLPKVPPPTSEKLVPPGTITSTSPNAPPNTPPNTPASPPALFLHSLPPMGTRSGVSPATRSLRPLSAPTLTREIARTPSSQLPTPQGGSTASPLPPPPPPPSSNDYLASLDSSPPSSPPPLKVVPTEVTALMDKLFDNIQKGRTDLSIDRKGKRGKVSDEHQLVGPVKLELKGVDKEEAKGAYWDPAFLVKHCHNIQKRNSTQKTLGTTYKIEAGKEFSEAVFQEDLKRAEQYKSGLKMLETLAKEAGGIFSQQAAAKIEEIKDRSRGVYRICLSIANEKVASAKRGEMQLELDLEDLGREELWKQFDQLRNTHFPAQQPFSDQYSKAIIVSQLLSIRAIKGEEAHGFLKNPSSTTIDQELAQKISLASLQLVRTTAPSTPIAIVPPSPQLAISLEGPIKQMFASIRNKKVLDYFQKLKCIDASAPLDTQFNLLAQKLNEKITLELPKGNTDPNPFAFELDDGKPDCKFSIRRYNDASGKQYYQLGFGPASSGLVIGKGGYKEVGFAMEVSKDFLQVKPVALFTINTATLSKATMDEKLLIDKALGQLPPTENKRGVPMTYSVLGKENPDTPTEKLFLVSDLYDSDGLHFMKVFDKVTVDQKLKVAQDLVNGLRLLHDANILHKDLKAENFLIRKSQTPDSSSEFEAILTDLGLAVDCSGQGTPCDRNRIHVRSTPGMMDPAAIRAFKQKQKDPPATKFYSTYEDRSAAVKGEVFALALGLRETLFGPSEVEAETEQNRKLAIGCGENTRDTQQINPAVDGVGCDGLFARLQKLHADKEPKGQLTINSGERPFKEDLLKALLWRASDPDPSKRPLDANAFLQELNQIIDVPSAPTSPPRISSSRASSATSLEAHRGSPVPSSSALGSRSPSLSLSVSSSSLGSRSFVSTQSEPSSTRSPSSPPSPPSPLEMRSEGPLSSARRPLTEERSLVGEEVIAKRDCLKRVKENAGQKGITEPLTSPVSLDVAISTPSNGLTPEGIFYHASSAENLASFTTGGIDPEIAAQKVRWGGGELGEGFYVSASETGGIAYVCEPQVPNIIIIKLKILNPKTMRGIGIQGAVRDPCLTRLYDFMWSKDEGMGAQMVFTPRTGGSNKGKNFQILEIKQYPYVDVCTDSHDPKLNRGEVKYPTH